MPLNLNDPKTKKYLTYGIPVAAVALYVLYKKSKSAATPTSSTAPIGSSGNLSAGQLSDLQQGYANGFNQLQNEIQALGSQGSGTSPSGAPTGGGTISTNPPAGYPAVPADLSGGAMAQAPPSQQAPAAVGSYHALPTALSPEMISMQQQPQNQPAVNPNVSPAPAIQLQPGQSPAPATGVGQRYVTPEGYAFTAG